MPRLRVVQTLTAGVEHVRPFVPPGRGAVQRPRHPRHLDRRAGAHLDPGLAAGRPGLRPGRASVHEWSYGPRPALADKRVLIVGYGAIGAAHRGHGCGPSRPRSCGSPGRPREGVHAHRRAAGAAARGRRRRPRRPPHRPDPRARRRRLPGPDEAQVRCSSTSPGARWSTPTPWSQPCTPGRVHAALDVVDPEPLPPDHPLWEAPHLLLTPHVGGASSAHVAACPPAGPRAAGPVRRRPAAGQQDHRRLLT